VASHVYLWLTLIGRYPRHCEERSDDLHQNECRATNVIRHGLCPMF
jgi:hypothetical protein